MANDEPKIHRETKSFGEVELLFEGEQYTGGPIADTKVTIGGQLICWITWADRGSFTENLQAIVTEHRI